MKPTRTLPYPLLKTIAGSLAALLLGTLPGRAQLPLQENDVVAIIGNALGDRMQHDGWVETVIQSKMAGKKLRFRNLAIVGDSVAHRPRHQGFDTPEKSLTNCKADVIFAFFGYNESFAGEGGLAKFKTDLAAMVDKYRGSQFNGKSAPRIVLFSPIAHENRKSPNLPNGAANNVNLALYTAAIKQVAEEKGVAFVDLFATTQARYTEAKTPLTMNGIHLLPEGNRQLGEIIASALTGQAVTAPAAALEPLRQAVLDKDWHWHNRFRATDGNDIWGNRSGLKFVNGQTNAVVLQQELTMLRLQRATAHRGDLEHRWQKPQLQRPERGQPRLPERTGSPRQTEDPRWLRTEPFRRRVALSGDGQSRADAGGHKGPALGRLLGHLPEMGAAQADE
jgi:hypothetical protein